MTGADRIRRRGCRACPHAPDGCSVAMPEYGARNPCGRDKGSCPYGLDALEQLPDEKADWRPMDEVPWDTTSEGERTDNGGPNPGMMGCERVLYTQNDPGDRADLDEELDRRDPYLRMLRFLVPVLSERQAEVVTAYLDGVQHSAVAGSHGTTKQTAHVHWRRSLALMATRLEEVDMFAGLSAVGYFEPKFRCDLAAFLFSAFGRMGFMEASVFMAVLHGVGGFYAVSTYLGLKPGESQCYMYGAWAAVAREMDATQGWTYASGLRRCMRERISVEQAFDLDRKASTELRTAVAGAWKARYQTRRMDRTPEGKRRRVQASDVESAGYPGIDETWSD